MENQERANIIAGGTIHYTGRSENVSCMEWTAHPEFKGVYLKHLIKGRDTDGCFSAHLVRIEPGGCLGSHCHESQVELHEVIGGNGSCTLVNDTFDYHPGKVTVILKGTTHQVRADKNGLMILAKFWPALV